MHGPIKSCNLTAKTHLRFVDFIITKLSTVPFQKRIHTITSLLPTSGALTLNRSSSATIILKCENILKKQLIHKARALNTV